MPISREDAELLKRTPVTDTVPKQKKSMSSSAQRQLGLIQSLRARRLISIKLDWDQSTGGQVSRTLEITPAGLAALNEYRQKVTSR